MGLSPWTSLSPSAVTVICHRAAVVELTVRQWLGFTFLPATSRSQVNSGDTLRFCQQVALVPYSYQIQAKKRNIVFSLLLLCLARPKQFSFPSVEGEISGYILQYISTLLPQWMENCLRCSAYNSKM